MVINFKIKTENVEEAEEKWGSVRQQILTETIKIY